MKSTSPVPNNIRAIIGLGNPGSKFARTRHNIGFWVVDHLVEYCGSSWSISNDVAIAQLNLPAISVAVPESTTYAMKPLTFMNNSGVIAPHLRGKGIPPEQCLVVHDELEKKFGQLVFSQGGSAKGHNGLRSIIERMGMNFWRLKFGIGRPEHKEHVPDYVLAPFTKAEQADLEVLVQDAIAMIVSKRG